MGFTRTLIDNKTGKVVSSTKSTTVPSSKKEAFKDGGSVISPDGNKVKTKTDSQGRVKKIVTIVSPENRPSTGEKRIVDRFSMTERQASSQANNPTFKKEDSIESMKKGGSVFESAKKSDAIRRKMPKGY